MKNYGLPYQGSKQKIIDFIITNLPPARHLYDLFGGGGSVTCAALASGNYLEFYAWALQQRELVIISEYWMPCEFICIAELPTVCTFGNQRKDIKERLFIPRNQERLYRKMAGMLF